MIAQYQGDFYNVSTVEQSNHMRRIWKYSAFAGCTAREKKSGRTIYEKEVPTHELDGIYQNVVFWASWNGRELPVVSISPCFYRTLSNPMQWRVTLVCDDRHFAEENGFRASEKDRGEPIEWEKTVPLCECGAFRMEQYPVDTAPAHRNLGRNEFVKLFTNMVVKLNPNSPHSMVLISPRKTPDLTAAAMVVTAYAAKSLPMRPSEIRRARVSFARKKETVC